MVVRHACFNKPINHVKSFFLCFVHRRLLSKCDVINDRCVVTGNMTGFNFSVRVVQSYERKNKRSSCYFSFCFCSNVNSSVVGFSSILYRTPTLNVKSGLVPSFSVWKLLFLKLDSPKFSVLPWILLYQKDSKHLLMSPS